MLSVEHQGTVVERGLGREATLGTVGAVAGVSACYLVAWLTGAALEVAVRGGGPVEVPFGAAVFAVAAAGLGAYVLAQLARRTPRPRRNFLLLAIAGLLASAVPPLQAATAASTAIWLLVMHVAAALALVPMVAYALPSVRPIRAAKVAPVERTPVAGPAPVNDRP